MQAIEAQGCVRRTTSAVMLGILFSWGACVGCDRTPGHIDQRTTAEENVPKGSELKQPKFQLRSEGPVTADGAVGKIQRFQSSSGALVVYESTRYSTRRDALVAYGRDVQKAFQVVESDSIHGPDAESAGKRVVMIQRDPRADPKLRPLVEWTEGATLFKIGSAALPDALEFEKWKLHSQTAETGDQTEDGLGLQRTMDGVLGGSEFKGSFHDYQASDGTRLRLEIRKYPSDDLARRALRADIRHALKVIESGSKRNAAGIIVGDRAVMISSGPKSHSRVALVGWTIGSEFYRVESASLPLVYAFEGEQSHLEKEDVVRKNSVP